MRSCLTKRIIIILRLYTVSVTNTDLRFSDISTGEIYTTEISGADEALNEIARYEPKEILLNSDAAEKLSAQVELRFHITPDECTDDFFENSEFEKNILQQFGKIPCRK